MNITRRKKTQQGFTLIELLVVVVIISILASIAIPNFVGAQDKAKNAGVQSNVHNVQMALEQYAVDKAGDYPADKTAFFTNVVSDSGYMAGGKFPATPWGFVQASGIALDADASISDKAGTTYGTGKAEIPAAVSDYGSIAYLLHSTTTNADDAYDLAGYGKHGDKYQLVLPLKNW